jgi:hypothetical protein
MNIFVVDLYDNVVNSTSIIILSKKHEDDHEWLIWKVMDIGGCNLFQDTNKALAWRGVEKSRKSLLKTANNPANI